MCFLSELAVRGSIISLAGSQHRNEYEDPLGGIILHSFDQQAQGPKTPRPITIEQCFHGYGASTDLVRSGYGAARSRGVFGP